MASKIDLGDYIETPDVQTNNKVRIPDKTIYQLGFMLFAVIVGAILANGIVQNLSG